MEKNIIVENERIYETEDIRIAAIELSNSRSLLLFSIVSLIFAAVGGSTIGLSFVFDHDISMLISGIMACAMILVVWGLYFFVRYRIDKRNYKGSEYKYTFYDDEVKISVNSENFNQHVVLKYQNIKCVKCKTYTFLSVDNTKAYFFKNSDLNEDVFKTLKAKVKKYKGK